MQACRSPDSQGSGTASGLGWWVMVPPAAPTSKLARSHCPEPEPLFSTWSNGPRGARGCVVLGRARAPRPGAVRAPVLHGSWFSRRFPSKTREGEGPAQGQREAPPGTAAHRWGRAERAPSARPVLEPSGQWPVVRVAGGAA